MQAARPPAIRGTLHTDSGCSVLVLVLVCLCVQASLWAPERSAMFDRRADDSIVPTLMHNSLRMMWQGLFSQEMADSFIRDNLMNRSRFWTRMPLPSIAVSDPHFYNDKAANGDYCTVPHSYRNGCRCFLPPEKRSLTYRDYWPRTASVTLIAHQ